MRHVAWALLAIVAYAAFLVAGMPASFVAERASQATRGALAMRDAQGSAWNGEAAATWNSPAGPIALERLAWSFRPSRLLAGRLALDVQASSGELQASAELGRGMRTWEAQGVKVRGPASALARLVPLVAPWRPEGPVSVAAERLTWSDRGIEGTGTLEWRDAAVALSEVRPLGSYRARLAGDGGGVAKIEVATLASPLRVTGQGTLDAGGRFTFTGEARGEGPRAAALDPLLDLMGPRRPDGARTIAWR